MTDLERSFNLFGAVHLKVISESTGDFEIVQKTLGSLPSPLDNAPSDLVLRFVRELQPALMNLLGINKFGYTEDGFFILNPYSGAAEARIPFEAIGGPCEIICQQGVSKIPLLPEILKLVFLKKRILSLHASALQIDEAGVVLAGWARGGKTSALLAYIQHGAKFITDDWVLYDIDKDQIFGFPGILSITKSNLKQIPQLWKKIKFSKKALLGLMQASVSVLGYASKLLKSNQLRKLGFKLSQKQRLNLNQEFLFKPEQISDSAQPGLFILLTSHNSEQFFSKAVSKDRFVTSLINVGKDDMRAIEEAYLAYRYVFPEKANLFFEDRENLEKQLLFQAVSNKECLRLYHPYPLSSKDFYENFVLSRLAKRL